MDETAGQKTDSKSTPKTRSKPKSKTPDEGRDKGGRPPNWLKEYVRTQLIECKIEGEPSTIDLALDAIRRTLTDIEAKPSDHINASKLALEYSVGKPAVQVEVSGQMDMSRLVLEESAAKAGVGVINAANQ